MAEALCYVSGSWLYFTTQPLDKQWGDDWNDAPYEHNAGAPYDGNDWAISVYAWQGPFEEPSEGQLNSGYSVEHINQRMVPWLQSSRYGATPGAVKVWAGMTVAEVSALIRKGGGTFFVPSH